MILEMNTDIDIKKSKGRPKGPSKVALYRRVTPEQREKILELLGEVRLGGRRAVSASRDLAELTGSLGQAASENPKETPTFQEATKKVMTDHAETFWKLRVSELEDKIRDLEQAAPTTNDSKQLAALLDDIQKLADANEDLQLQLQECRDLTYDEKMGYWKERALKAEAYAASKNE